jgi:hypothetical protein
METAARCHLYFKYKKCIVTSIDYVKQADALGESLGVADGASLVLITLPLMLTWQLMLLSLLLLILP